MNKNLAIDDLHKPGNIWADTKQNQLRYQTQKDEPANWVHPLSVYVAGVDIKRGQPVSIGFEEDIDKSKDRGFDPLVIPSNPVKYEWSIGIAMETVKAGEKVHVLSSGKIEYKLNDNRDVYQPPNDGNEYLWRYDNAGKMIYVSAKEPGTLTMDLVDAYANGANIMTIGHLADAPDRESDLNQTIAIEIQLAGDTRGIIDATEFAIQLENKVWDSKDEQPDWLNDYKHDALIFVKIINQGDKDVAPIGRIITRIEEIAEDMKVTVIGAFIARNPEKNTINLNDYSGKKVICHRFGLVDGNFGFGPLDIGKELYLSNGKISTINEAQYWEQRVGVVFDAKRVLIDVRHPKYYTRREPIGTIKPAYASRDTGEPAVDLGYILLDSEMVYPVNIGQNNVTVNTFQKMFPKYPHKDINFYELVQHIMNRDLLVYHKNSFDNRYNIEYPNIRVDSLISNLESDINLNDTEDYIKSLSWGNGEWYINIPREPPEDDKEDDINIKLIFHKVGDNTLYYELEYDGKTLDLNNTELSSGGSILIGGGTEENPRIDSLYENNYLLEYDLLEITPEYHYVTANVTDINNILIRPWYLYDDAMEELDDIVRQIDDDNYLNPNEFEQRRVLTINKEVFFSYNNYLKNELNIFLGNFNSFDRYNILWSWLKWDSPIIYDFFDINKNEQLKAIVEDDDIPEIQPIWQGEFNQNSKIDNIHLSYNNDADTNLIGKIYKNIYNNNPDRQDQNDFISYIYSLSHYNDLFENDDAKIYERAAELRPKYGSGEFTSKIEEINNIRNKISELENVNFPLKDEILDNSISTFNFVENSKHIIYNNNLGAFIAPLENDHITYERLKEIEYDYNQSKQILEKIFNYQTELENIFNFIINTFTGTDLSNPNNSNNIIGRAIFVSDAVAGGGGSMTDSIMDKLKELFKWFIDNTGNYNVSTLRDKIYQDQILSGLSLFPEVAPHQVNNGEEGEDYEEWYEDNIVNGGVNRIKVVGKIDVSFSTSWYDPVTIRDNYWVYFTGFKNLLEKTFEKINECLTTNNFNFDSGYNPFNNIIDNHSFGNLPVNTILNNIRSEVNNRIMSIITTFTPDDMLVLRNLLKSYSIKTIESSSFNNLKSELLKYQDFIDIKTGSTKDIIFTNLENAINIVIPDELKNKNNLFVELLKYHQKLSKLPIGKVIYNNYWLETDKEDNPQYWDNWNGYIKWCYKRLREVYDKVEKYFDIDKPDTILISQSDRLLFKKTQTINGPIYIYEIRVLKHEKEGNDVVNEYIYKNNIIDSISQIEYWGFTEKMDIESHNHSLSVRQGDDDIKTLFSKAIKSSNGQPINFEPAFLIDYSKQKDLCGLENIIKYIPFNTAFNYGYPTYTLSGVDVNEIKEYYQVYAKNSSKIKVLQPQQKRESQLAMMRINTTILSHDMTYRPKLENDFKEYTLEIGNIEVYDENYWKNNEKYTQIEQHTLTSRENNSTTGLEEKSIDKYDLWIRYNNFLKYNSPNPLKGAEWFPNDYINSSFKVVDDKGNPVTNPTIINNDFDTISATSSGDKDSIKKLIDPTIVKHATSLGDFSYLSEYVDYNSFHISRLERIKWWEEKLKHKAKLEQWAPFKFGDDIYYSIHNCIDKTHDIGYVRNVEGLVIADRVDKWNIFTTIDDYTNVKDYLFMFKDIYYDITYSNNKNTPFEFKTQVWSQIKYLKEGHPENINHLWPEIIYHGKINPGANSIEPISIDKFLGLGFYVNADNLIQEDYDFNLYIKVGEDYIHYPPGYFSVPEATNTFYGYQWKFSKENNSSNKLNWVIRIIEVPEGGNPNNYRGIVWPIDKLRTEIIDFKCHLRRRPVQYHGIVYNQLLSQFPDYSLDVNRNIITNNRIYFNEHRALSPSDNKNEEKLVTVSPKSSYIEVHDDDNDIKRVTEYYGENVSTNKDILRLEKWITPFRKASTKSKPIKWFYDFENNIINNSAALQGQLYTLPTDNIDNELLINDISNLALEIVALIPVTKFKYENSIFLSEIENFVLGTTKKSLDLIPEPIPQINTIFKELLFTEDGAQNIQTNISLLNLAAAETLKRLVALETADTAVELEELETRVTALQTETLEKFNILETTITTLSEGNILERLEALEVKIAALEEEN